ncbi:hypothetical protein [Burkholderia glumae]|uniref:hypothetical protein n=1 Tax=Burkholderia glumae TaxID=337 RepID=UPI00148E9705|nr:hypothetical protein [Burkholderia glumae]QJW79760.1 hypothetical protein GAS18_14045 [Burkholderia glumae]
MSTGEISGPGSADLPAAIEKIMRIVQRRVAAIGIPKVAEDMEMDQDELADFIFGATDGASPKIVSYLERLINEGFKFVPIDSAVLDTKTLRDLVYGALASLEAAKEDLRRDFGRDLVDKLVQEGINPEDGFSVIQKIVQLQDELAKARDNPGEIASGSDLTKPAVGKSRSTMIRLIGGLVQANYKIDLRSGRLDGIGAILRDLETVGVSLDEGTLRDYLREAARKVDSRPKAGDS